jgi:hypothetical protein
MCLAWASDAAATCSSTDRQVLPSAAKLAYGGAGQATVQRLPPGLSDPIVGMWLAELRLENGDLYEQSLQLFHADGTEMQVSNGIPPVLGNVCVGVWESAGSRTVKLRHMAWNWAADGTFLGTYVFLATLEVDRQDNHYRGTWTADSFDVGGVLVPDAHAEGNVAATRVTAD